MLFKYLNLKPTFFEIKESVDMWRWLENNEDVKMVKTKFTSYLETKAIMVLPCNP